MNNKGLLAIVAVVGVIVVGGLAWAMAGNRGMTTNTTTDTNGTMTQPTGSEMTSPTGMMVQPTGMTGTTGMPTTGTTTQGTVKEFMVEAGDFFFKPTDIKVKKGDTVKLTLKNTGKMPHDWVVEGYDDVATSQIQGGEEEEIEFTADKAGTFVVYCSVGNHRQRGMVGKLIVE